MNRYVLILSLVIGIARGMEKSVEKGKVQKIEPITFSHSVKSIAWLDQETFFSITDDGKSERLCKGTRNNVDLMSIELLDIQQSSIACIYENKVVVSNAWGVLRQYSTDDLAQQVAPESSVKNGLLPLTTYRTADKGRAIIGYAEGKNELVSCAIHDNAHNFSQKKPIPELSWEHRDYTQEITSIVPFNDNGKGNRKGSIVGTRSKKPYLIEFFKRQHSYIEHAHFSDDNYPTALAVSHDNERVAVGTSKGELLLWDRKKCAWILQKYLDAAYTYISHVLFSPNGQWCAIQALTKQEESSSAVFIRSTISNLIKRVKGKHPSFLPDSKSVGVVVSDGTQLKVYPVPKHEQH